MSMHTCKGGNFRFFLLLQKASREQGLPWTLGKSFDTACPVSRFVSPDELPNPNDVKIWSKVNGKLMQVRFIRVNH